MKKISAIVLLIVLTLSLVACADAGTPGTTTTPSITTTTPSVATTSPSVATTSPSVATTSPTTSTKTP